MENFDFAFSLVGLILGLAVVEVLSGLVRTLLKHDLRAIGWLTPMLGIAVICDLTTYWGMLSGFRSDMPQMYLAMGSGVIVTSIYYVAASMVFPSNDVDLDVHYFRYKRKILALIVAVNLPVIGYQLPHWPPIVYLITGLWFFLVAVTYVARNKPLNYASLGALIALYVYMYVNR